MNFIAGVLTFLLIINCVLLVLLILIQLPKKDAGVGLAFGGGAADALFGAGSGNVLTKITKWGTGTFFALSLVLGLMEVNLNRNSTSEFEKQLQQKQSQMPAGQPPAVPTATAPATAAPTATNAPGLLLLPTNSAPPPAAAANPSTAPAQPK